MEPDATTTGFEAVAILFVLATLAIAAFALLRHRRAITTSSVTAPDRLRNAATHLRTGLESMPQSGGSTKVAELHEELGAVMQELSSRTVDAEAPDEAINSYRQAAGAFRANGRRMKGDELDIHLGLLLYDFGLRAVESAKLRESEHVFEKFLAHKKGKWPFQLPREFYQAARAGALTELGVRLGDESLLWEALPLCASIRKSTSSGKTFKPPMFAVDAVAGGALTVIGRALGDRSALIDAIEANRRAIKAKKGLGVPHMLAASQDSLGQALAALGELERKTETVQEAVEAYEESLENIDFDERPASWGQVQAHLGRSLTALGRLQEDPALLSRALVTYQNALAVFSTESLPFFRADALDALGEVLFALARLRRDSDIAGLAIDAHRKSETILQSGDLTGALARVRGNIEAAEALSIG